MTYTPSMMEPTQFQVSYRGTIENKAAYMYKILGSRDSGWTSTSAFGDTCQYLDTSQALMNTPTTGQTLYLRSSSINDAAAGTGVRTVRIVYLDSSGNQQVRTDTINGTTVVDIGTGYSAIQWMQSATVGTGGIAAGNITISSTNGAPTVATTFEQISTGGGKSLSGRFKVPTGFNAYTLNWSSNAINNTMDTRLRADVFSDDRTISSDSYHFIDRMFLSSGTSGTSTLHWLKFPEGATLKISAIPGAAAAGNRVDVDFTVVLVAV